MSFSPGRLVESLLASLAAATTAESATPSGLCIALSGGLDSSVLLVALAQARAQASLPPMRAIHVDHGLSARSGEWSESCRKLAAAWSIPFESVPVDAHAAAGTSPEAAARDARYGALRERMIPGEVLLTAHHADDQLETVLLQWLRGGGLRALAGMPGIARLGEHAWHARPLLRFARADLLDWAEQEHLQWEEDPSNRDTGFDRNYLRHEVLPVVRRRWPAAARTINRVAEYARDAVEFETAMALQDLEQVAVGSTLDLPALRELSDARQRALLRTWLRELGLPLPSAQSLAALRHDFLMAAADRNPAVAWPGAVVHRYRNRLYALPRGGQPLRTGPWDTSTAARFVLSGEAALELIASQGAGLSRARLPTALRIAARGSGESFVPAGFAHRRPLRKWLQERNVLPWRRTEVPLVFAGDTLVAVGDLGFCADFAAAPGEPSLRFVWHGRGMVTESDALRLK